VVPRRLSICEPKCDENGESALFLVRREVSTGARCLGSVDLGAALIMALALKTPHFYPLEIISGPKYAIEGLAMHLHNWEDQGWIGTQNASLFKMAAYLLNENIIYLGERP
jgi:hypothetical protein